MSTQSIPESSTHGARELSVLLVEDDDSDAAFLRSLLDRARLRPYKFERVSTLAAAVAVLAPARTENAQHAQAAPPDRPFDIVLLDLGLPDTQGLDGASRIIEVAPQVPIIVLTGADDDELALRAATQNVQDYLVKWEFDPTSLARSIRYAVERHTLRMQLKAEKERAESASRAKSEFLANMSHEIRTPMNIVLGMAEVLRGTPLSPVQKEQLDRLQRAGDHLMDLIDNVLDLSRIEAGRVELEGVSFDFCELLTTITEFVRPLANAKHLDLVVDVEPGLPRTLIGDPRRLRQVLLNLLGNAVKFTERGRIELIVAHDPDGHADGALWFRVADTGPGIPEDRLRSVFDQFVQADATVARKHGGAGLGLSIASNLVNLMHGRIWADSEVGRGTTFNVRVTLQSVPAERESGTVAKAAPDVDTIRRALITSGNRMRILVVDDMADNHALVEAYLGGLPVEITSALSGEQAIAAFAADTFDIVYVDLHMPDMDGFTTVRGLREHERSTYAAPTPMIAMSADVLTESMDRAKRSGCDGYLAKPLRRATFLESLWRYGKGGEVPMEKLSDEPIIDPDLIPILPRFLSNRRADCTTMRAAVESGDFSQIAILAHNMKGTGAAFGFPRLSELGGQLEAYARKNDGPNVALKLAELSHELESVDRRVGKLAPRQGEAKHG
jgi:signal transduction histidine kinase/HPt (histidine-containing phosphotransfer) domain-containing protein